MILGHLFYIVIGCMQGKQLNREVHRCIARALIAVVLLGCNSLI